MTMPLTAPSSPALPTGTGFLTVGLDVGGTKTACVVTDADDKVLLHEVVPTDSTRLPDQLSEIIQRAVDRFPADGDGRASARSAWPCPAMSSPRAAPSGSRSTWAAATTSVDAARRAADRLGRRCRATSSTTRAPQHRGSSTRIVGRDAPRDLAYLSVGTGISAGIVLDGRILRGANGLAGEVGHVSADPDGGRCVCGLIGCLEHVAAGPAIARAAHEAVAAGRASTLGPDSTPTDVFRAAQAGDALACELATTFAERLARAIRGLVLTLGVDLRRHRRRCRRCRRGASAARARGHRPRARGFPLVEAAFADARVEILPPQVEAGARGAAAIARRRVLADQRKGVGER